MFGRYHGQWAASRPALRVLALAFVFVAGFLSLMVAIRSDGTACSTSPFLVGAAGMGCGGIRDTATVVDDAAHVTALVQAHAAEIGGSCDLGDAFDWHERDTEYLVGLVRRAAVANSERTPDAARDRRKLARLLRAETSLIHEAAARLEATPAYHDPELGFRVYDTVQTGWLHVADVAVRARLALLRGMSEADVRAASDLYRLADGTHLYDADPDRLPQVGDVVRALRAMDLPREAFAGYGVYLLPLSMGATSGLGTREYAIVGAVALGRDAIAEQTEVTIAHELGHRIQLARLGSSYWSNPAGWRRYMTLRGIGEWSADGSAASAAWSRSPEETFAEDVRVLFGSERAAAAPHATAYGDPRVDQRLVASLRGFVFDLASRRDRGEARR